MSKQHPPPPGAPCPRCKTGNYKPGRSLSMHISMHCPDALLFDRIMRDHPNSKRSHDQMLYGSTSTGTFIQTAKALNAVPALLSVPQRDRLMAMPSLAQLCSTQYDDVYNTNDTDILYPGNEQTDNQVNNNVALETCPFQKNKVRLPPDVAFQVHLASVLQHHRGNDLNMFQEITSCISKHAVHHGIDFTSMHMFSREKLVKRLTDLYKLDFLRPTLHHVLLSDNTKATVPIYDVKALLLSFLNDPNRMKNENFAANYDIFSGKPTSTVTDLNEIHTGSAWTDALQKYIGDDQDAFPLALIAFYDKTHSDNHGALACAPFIVTPSFLNIDCRNDDKNYMVLGYIPNLSHGKGTKNRQSSTLKLQDEHNCLKLITKQIIKIHEEGGFWTTVMGRKVRVVVWIHFIAGDTSGHNNIVGHMNGSNAKYPFRDCYCPLEQLSDSIPTCTLVTTQDIDEARLTSHGIKAISKLNIINAFDNCPMSDSIHGIMGIVPSEMLHVSGTGILMYMLAAVDQLLGKKKSNKQGKELFDELHRCLVMDAQRQSEREMPRMSIRNGITDGTKMCGSERVGNYFILLCAVNTHQGRALLGPHLSKKKISFFKFRNCMKLYLAFEQWVNESHPIQEVKDATGLLAHLIRGIQKCFPKFWGHLWNIPKMHGLAKMLHYMLKFGMAKNFSGQIGERALKGIVKDHAQKTQRRPDKFAQQCALREFEDKVIQYVAKDMAGQISLNCTKQRNTSCKFVVEGQYMAHFSTTDTQGRGSVDIVWANKKRNKLSITISDQLSYCIRKFAFNNGYQDAFTVTGFTTLKTYKENCETSVKYYANEFMLGQPRYDFAMVKFVSEDNSIETCPAKVIGFIKYNVTRGIPTPHFSVELQQSVQERKANDDVDNHLYVVIHAASTYLSVSKLRKAFVSRFTLGNIDQCMYIINVEDILGPLFVFQNYGGEGSAANQLFCTLSQRQWGKYFSDRIEKFKI